VNAPHERILVIKLGALGDFVQALGPMAAIRKHHRNADIVLLTTSPYVDFARAANLFDDVWVDAEKPKPWQISKVLNLRQKLKSGNFDRVYDLQTSDRSSFYYYILAFGTKPEWSGIAKGSSHPHNNPTRDLMHTHERQREQLAVAGIDLVPVPDLSWAQNKEQDQGLHSKYGLVPPYALLVPGGAPHRPAKRWPVERYVELANHMLGQGITPILLGAGAERGILHLIEHDAPGSVNLCAKTSFLDIATLALGAVVAVGNDTGPMHLIAAANCACVVLYSFDSNPDLCAQRGKAVKILRQESLESLIEAEVWQSVETFVDNIDRVS